MNTTIKHVVVLSLMLALAACEGSVGPTGPQGPVGASGPGLRTVGTTIIALDGTARIQLPASFGTMDNPPAISCFIAREQGGPWLVVATDLSSGLSCGIGASGGSLVVVLVSGPPFWFFRVVAVF